MTMRTTHWLHLEATGGDPWILPIWTAAKVAVQAGRVRSLGGEFGELGLYISTRLDILPRITRRIAEETENLYKAVQACESKYIFTETQQGYAFPVNANLKFCLIADIDALLFELNSCWELMRTLFQRIRGHVGCPLVGTVTSEMRTALGSDTDWWFRWVDQQRNFVTHEGTPYLVIDMTNGGRDLLVMRENLTTFADESKFFRYSELVAVAKGFADLKQRLQAYLIGLFG
jgi:hypothetical protein